MWIAEAGIINVIVDIPGIDGVSGSGSLVTVSFEVVGGKRDESELEISNVQLVDDEAEFIEVGKLVGAEIKVVDVIEVVEEEEEGEEEQPPGITAWEPAEEAVNSTEGESITFEISADQEVDISWQINGTEVQADEGEKEAEFTKSAVAGTWNVSVIATSTETGLSSMHTWIWSVTPTSTEEETPTPTPTLAPGVTSTPTPKATPTGQAVKATPTVKPTSTPKSKEATPTPTSKTPGFEVVFAIAALAAIAYVLRRR
jgi:PGF-CTERM protein